MGTFLLRYLVFVLLIVLTVMPLGVFGAETINFPKTRINPEIFLYPLKRLQENITLKFIPAEALYNFHGNLLKTRLAELKHVSEKRLLSHIEKSSQRFAYQAGILTDYIVSKKSDKESKEQLKNFEQYKQILIILRDLYEANSSYWILLQQDIDTLDLNASKLNK